MTVDYKNPSINQYKQLIREEARLYMEIRLAKVEGDPVEEKRLKKERMLIWNRIIILEAAIALKYKKMATA